MIILLGRIRLVSGVFLSQNERSVFPKLHDLYIVFCLKECFGSAEGVEFAYIEEM